MKARLWRALLTLAGLLLVWQGVVMLGDLPGRGEPGLQSRALDRGFCNR